MPCADESERHKKMLGFSAICCFPVDIAVRLIGSISLLANVLVFVALISNREEVLADDKIRIVYGFDSQFFNHDNRSHDDAEWFPIFCPVFTFTDAVSSALLIWASITAQPWLTVPWLFCSIFNVVCHVTSLAMLPFKRLPLADEWVTALTVLHSVALLYFTFVVTIAHYFWWIRSREMHNSPGNQELWENIYKSPPLFESPFKNQV